MTTTLTSKITFGDYVLKAHTEECMRLDERGGDPWNIYFRIGVSRAWAHMEGLPRYEETRTWEEWETSDERKRFWIFSNELSGKRIVDV